MTALFNIIYPLLIVLIFLTPTISVGQSNSIFDIMHFQEVLEMTIETDLDSIVNNRRSDEYQKAFLTFKDEKKESQKWKIKIRTRGKFRRQVCEMPPLKLKFKKATLADAGLNAFNDMKLVTHCVSSKEEAKKLLLKEYLTYQIYTELTPNSFRTQLVRITYKDIKSGKKIRNWGFLIEDTAQLAARLNAENCDCWGSTERDFEHGTTEILSLFQYMIGNEDYRLEALKNIKVLRRGNQRVPVPYDFDFSGLVNAPYAVPNADFNLKYITDRIYLGSKESLLRLHSTKALFHAKKHRMKTIIGNNKKLDNTTKAEMTVYLDDFFQNMDDVLKNENTAKLVNAKQGVAK